MSRLDLSEPSYICNPESLRNRHAKAYKLFKAGINLRMLIELHKSPSLIPPYLHNERVPVVHCVYDADEVGFRRHIVNPGDIVKFGVPPPETDQLGELDINEILTSTRRDLHRLRHKFVRPGRRLPFMEIFETDEEADALVDTDDDFEVDDLEEDDDMELDLELDEDDGFMDDESLQFFEHDGEFYVTMYETATEDEDEEEEMHDAVENQQTHPSDVD